MDKVLVTGGCGFIGSFLVEKLCEKKKDVVVFDNKWKAGEKNLQNVLNKIEFIEGDIRNYSQVRAAMKDCDTVFHLASIQGTKFFYENPDLVLEVGLVGNLNVAKSAAESKISRLLFTSSSENYAQPTFFPTPETHPLIIPDVKNPRWSYSSTKIVGEIIFINYAKKFGYDCTIVRIHNAYGPRMGWQHVIPEFTKRLILNETFTIEGSGEESRSFCFIDDIIDGIFLATEKDEGKNEIFNLGNDNEECKIKKLAEIIHEISGKKFNPVHINLKKGSAPRRLPDISKARKLLGYNPKISLQEGLKKTFDWYKNEIEWWQKNSRPNEYPWLK